MAVAAPVKYRGKTNQAEQLYLKEPQANWRYRVILHIT
jgi:hypothetical protein